MAWSSDCPYGTTATSQFRLIVASLRRTNHNNTVGGNPRHAVSGGRVRPEDCWGCNPTVHPHRLSAAAVKYGDFGGTCTSRRKPGWKVHVDRWQLPVPRTGCPSQAGGPDLSGGGFPVPVARPCSLPGGRRCRGHQTCRSEAGTRYAHPPSGFIRTLKADLPALETGTPYPEFCPSPMQKRPGPASGSDQTAILPPPKLPPVLVPNARSPTGQENLPVGQPDLTSWYWRLPSTFAWRTWGRPWRTGPAPVGPGNGEYGCG